MSDNEKDDKGAGLYRVDTVPPPDGESDAYNAPTKVGPIAPAAVLEMMRAAEEGAQKGQKKAVPPRPEPRPAAGAAPPAAGAAEPTSTPLSGSGPQSPRTTPASGRSAAAAPPADMPRLYEETVEDDQITRLSPSAKAPDVAPVQWPTPRPPPPVPAQVAAAVPIPPPVPAPRPIAQPDSAPRLDPLAPPLAAPLPPPISQPVTRPLVPMSPPLVGRADSAPEPPLHSLVPKPMPGAQLGAIAFLGVLLALFVVYVLFLR